MTRAVLIIALVAGIFGAGWSLGRTVLKAEIAAAARQAIENRDEINSNVEGMTDESLVDLLAR